MIKCSFHRKSSFHERNIPFALYSHTRLRLDESSLKKAELGFSHVPQAQTHSHEMVKQLQAYYMYNWLIMALLFVTTYITFSDYHALELLYM